MRHYKYCPSSHPEEPGQGPLESQRCQWASSHLGDVGRGKVCSLSALKLKPPRDIFPLKGPPSTWGLFCPRARARPLPLEWPAHLFEGDGVLPGLGHQCGHLSLESLHVSALIGPSVMQDELSHSLALEDAKEEKLSIESGGHRTRCSAQTSPCPSCFHLTLLLS